MSESTVTLLNNPYGKSSFEELRLKNRAFVDKSLMIKNLDDDSISDYPVLLRPRRFGKSTFVRMLKCFYDISYKDRYEELFSGTRIFDENLPTHNSYHVINFDFSAVAGKNEDDLVSSFFTIVTYGIDDFKLRYPDFIFDYSNIKETAPTKLFVEFAKAYKNYSKRSNLYVMIDEYDNFANELLSKNLDLFLAITSQNGFLKTFYSAIKAVADVSGCIAKTFITGVSSVSLDSLTSGFNIASNVTDRACFNEYAGFTEDELAILIPQLVDVKKLGVSTEEIISRMKPVYDGYCFVRKASQTVYNSSMCLYYLDKVRQEEEFLNPENYLDPACDQDGSKLEQIFTHARGADTQNIIDTYLRGGLFYLERLAENINLNHLAEYSFEQILSMLYYLGYLTIDPKASEEGNLALKIPNRYMERLFSKCIIDFKIRNNTAFTENSLNIEPLLSTEDDLTDFADSCTELLSGFMSNQVLLHMNEMALNLVLYAKLKSLSISGMYVELQKSIQVAGEGEKFADLVITVNKGFSDECIYLIELKYITKTETSGKDNEAKLQKLIKDATEEVLEYRSALDFKEKKVKSFVMVFAGPDCVYCKLQQLLF